MALLNEILGGLSVDEGDFSQEWTEVFGETEEGTRAASTRPTEAQDKENFFLPSQLLDQSLNNLQSSISGQRVCVCVLQLCYYTRVNQKIGKLVQGSSLVIKRIDHLDFAPLDRFSHHDHHAEPGKISHH